MTNEQLNALKAFIEALLTEHKKLIDEFIPAKVIAPNSDDTKKLEARIAVLERIKFDFADADTFEKLYAAAKKAQSALTSAPTEE